MAGAHILSFFNSKIYKNSKNKNPSWYLDDELDPMLDMLRCYDKIIQELLSLKNVELLVATGLSQKPYDGKSFTIDSKITKNF